mmetsp:Transcript_53120/g.124204  ORF Transcript_53120/g.124204 Transcript_53120/m.124204 type:complete len:781 (-) Transcript_53120:457-2799(-)
MTHQLREQRHRVLAAAAREQATPQAVAVGAPQAALGLEPFDGIGVEHLAPDVGVVAGGIVAHHVAEVGAAVARRHRREVDPLLLEQAGFGVEHRRGRRRGRGTLAQMPAQVEQGGAEVFGGRKTLVELLRGEHLVEQFTRHRLARAVVTGVVGQHGRPARPDLVHLGRVLDEVGRRLGAREARVAHLREHAVQRMAELVEQGADFVPGQQRRLAGRRLGDVEMVGHHRASALVGVLRHVFVHPRTALLARAGIEVGDEDGQLATVGIEDVVGAHIGLVDRQIGAALEAQAVELVGRKEDPLLQHAVEFEIGLDLAFIEAITGGAQLLRVEAPVPGRQRKARRALRRLVAVDQGLQLGGLAPGRSHGRRRELAQHRDGGSRRLGGALLDLEACVVHIAQQLGALLAQRDRARHQPGRVEGIAAAAARDRGAVQALAQRALAEHRLIGLARGVEQGDAVFAVEPGLLGGRRRGLDLVWRQTGQFLHVVDHHGRVIDLGEGALLVVGIDGRELGVDGLHARLRLGLEARAGAHHAAPVALDEAARLGVGRCLLAVLVERVDARKQLGVLQDGIALGGEARRVVGAQLQPCRIGVCGEQIEQQRRRACQQASALFQGLHRVGKARGGAVGGDGLDLRQLLGHAAVKRRREMLVTDLVEGREAQRQRAGREQRVGGGRGRSGLRQHHAGQAGCQQPPAAGASQGLPQRQMRSGRCHCVRVPSWGLSNGQEGASLTRRAAAPPDIGAAQSSRLSINRVLPRRAAPSATSGSPATAGPRSTRRRSVM